MPLKLIQGKQINVNLTGSFTGSFSGSFNGTGSYATQALSASWAPGGSSTFPYTGNAVISGSLQVSGSITGSLFGTSSYATQAISASNALTASYIQNAQSASYVLQAVSSSFATTASYVQNAQSASYVLQAVSASFATTASFAVSSSRAVTSSFALTSSYVNPLVQNVIITGSAQITGSLGITGSLNVSGSITGSLFGTSSWAASASTATSAPLYLPLAGGNMTGTLFGSGRTFQFQDLVLGYGTTFGTIKTDGTKYIGMYPTNGTESTRFLANGNVMLGTTFTDAGYRLQVSASGAVSGALQVIGTSVITGSLSVSAGITGSLFGTSSWAVSASHAPTAISASNSLTASYVNPLRQDVLITGSLNISGSEILTGYMQFMPVSTNINNSISASYMYVSGSTNDLYFTQNGSGYGNTTRLRWIEGNLYTGLLSGGVISSTLGSTTFNVSSGSGIIATLNASTASTDPFPTIQYVNWPTYTGLPITNSGSAKITYLSINSAGTVAQQTVPIGSTDVTQWDTQIELGVVLHLSGSVSTGVYNSPQVGYGFAQRTDDFVRAFGPMKLSGHTLQASGSSPTLSLKKGSGTAYNNGANYVNNPNHPSTVSDPVVNTSKIYRYYISGSTPIIDTGVANAGYDAIDSKYYVDTTTGTLALVGGAYWSIQRVFWIPNSPTNAFIVYYGNDRYRSLIDATNAKDSEPFIEAPNTAQNAIFLGYIIIQGGGSGTPARDLLNASEATIIPGGLFRSVGGVGSSGTTPIATTFSSLSDVSVASRTNGDLPIYNGSQWANGKVLTGNYSINGDLTVTGSIIGTASLATTASYALTASYVQNAQSASYILNAVSASFAVSASRALTASFALNGGGSLTGGTDGYIPLWSGSAALTSSIARQTSGSLQISGALYVTSSADNIPAIIAVQNNTNPQNGVAIHAIGNGSDNVILVDAKGGTNSAIRIFGGDNGISATAGDTAFNANASVGLYVAQTGDLSINLPLSSSKVGIQANSFPGATGDILNFTKDTVETFKVNHLGEVTAPSFTGSLLGSASYALTASYALNGGGTTINTSSLATTGSNNFKGNQNITGSLYVSSSTVTLGEFVGNQNGYVEFSVRNTNNGVSASSDIAVYADNGTVSNNYIDMGINNSGMDSTYSYFGTDFGNASDAYVYNVGGNLRIGNATSAAPYSQSLFLFSNPTATPNIWMTGSQVAINKNLGTPINGTFDISGSTVITGSLNVSGSITGSLFGTASYAVTASYALNAGGGGVSKGLVQAFSLGLQNIF